MAFQNRGGVAITANRVDGNLQCKANIPAPTGGRNIVQGVKEDQCASSLKIAFRRGRAAVRRSGLLAR